jgi:hypothetical protein
MNHPYRIRAALATLAGALLALATAPAALASPLRPPPPHPAGTGHMSAPVRLIVEGGGMPGWQITLIAVGTALTTAVVAVLLDRAHRARKAPAAIA